MHDPKVLLEALPSITLAAWTADNTPDDKMLWKRAALAQFATFEALATETGAGAHVIGTHRSKSIALPVVALRFGGGIAYAVIRENFYDYKVTIVADDPVDLGDLAVDGDRPIHACYCEGFPEGLVLGMYSGNRRAFTVEIHDDEKLRSLLGAIARHCGSGVRGDEMAKAAEG